MIMGGNEPEAKYFCRDEYLLNEITMTNLLFIGIGTLPYPDGILSCMHEGESLNDSFCVIPIKLYVLSITIYSTLLKALAGNMYISL